MLKSKKGFTIVELVIVIAVVAILAAVLIPSFSSLNKKAKDSAYLQERTNQQIADLAEKVENQKFLTWEDLEAKLAEEIAKIEIPAGSNLTEAQVTDAIAKAIAKLENSLKTDDTALTEAQVKAIIEKALEGQLTTAQVEGIVNAAVKNIPEASTLSADQVKAIVENAVAGLDKQTGITKEEMASAIETALKAQPGLEAADVTTIINNALAGFGYGNDLSASQIENIIKNAMAASKDKADVLAAEEMTAVIKAANATEFTAAVEALTAAGYNVSALTPIREGFIFTWDETTKGIVCIEGTTGSIVEEGAGLVVADVKDSASFRNALTNGNAITLEANVSVDSALYSPANTSTVIDLGGNTLSTGMSDATKHFYAFDVYGTVTLTNGTVDARGIKIYNGGKLIIGEGAKINHVDDNGGACLWVYEGAEVVVDGGEFIASKSKNAYQTDPAVMSNFGGKVTINGGTFEATKSHAYAINNFSGEIIINDGDFSGYRGVIAATGGTVTINGGTFAKTNDMSSSYVVYAAENAEKGTTGKVIINNGTFTTAGDPDKTMFYAGNGGVIEDNR